MTPSAGDHVIGKKSISIVDINPNDMTVTTSNENVFEVEAVMDVTIDIGKATTLTLADYLARGVTSESSSTLQNCGQLSSSKPSGEQGTERVMDLD